MTHPAMFVCIQKKKRFSALFNHTCMSLGTLLSVVVKGVLITTIDVVGAKSKEQLIAPSLSDIGRNTWLVVSVVVIVVVMLVVVMVVGSGDSGC